jgi:hypothetical protein
MTQNDSLLTNDDSLLANDDSLLANDDSLLTNDDSLLTNDDSPSANNDSLLTNDDSPFANDDSPSIKLVFGCRHPESAKGSWDRACVVCQCHGDSTVTYGIFNSGKDYVATTKNIQIGVDMYHKFLKEGWVDMDDTDITATSGTYISPDTIRVPPKSHRFRTWIGGIIVGATALFLFHLAKRKKIRLTF